MTHDSGISLVSGRLLVIGSARKVNIEGKGEGGKEAAGGEEFMATVSKRGVKLRHVRQGE